MRKKLFCILGRSGAGKSSIAKAVAERYGLTIVKSYTTRQPRPGEIDGNSDHLFITEEQADEYLSHAENIAAMTTINNIRYFTTKDILMKSDIYVIDPRGYCWLKDVCSNMDLDIIPIYITISKYTARDRVFGRGDKLAQWEARWAAETQMFDDWEKYYHGKYQVFNNCDFDDSVNRVAEIIKKEMEST